jgi:PQQ-dependent catabolism-associated CXXCW motif protein
MRVVIRLVFFALACVVGTAARAQSFAYEDKDWGVSPTTMYRNAQFHAPTPLTLSGARTLKTLELKEMLAGSPAPTVIDVLSGKAHKTLPGAIWLPWAGLGQLPRNQGIYFEETLAKLTGGDKTRAVVFFCLSSECWLSYNASLRAVDLGYTNVLWYRGGIDAWKGASLDTVNSVEHKVD